MADLPRLEFPVPAENAIASYDYFDFASGFGYRKLYLSTTENSTTTSYILTPQQIHSTHGKTSVGVSEDRDFDIEFASPQTIEGDLILRFVEHAPTGSATITPVFTVYHVTSGGTETSLGTATAPTVSVGANGAAYLIVMKIAISGQDFKIGEKLRINLTTTGTSPGKVYIDPTGAIQTITEEDTNRSITSEAYALVPFRVNR